MATARPEEDTFNNPGKKQARGKKKKHHSSLGQTYLYLHDSHFKLVPGVGVGKRMIPSRQY